MESPPESDALAIPAPPDDLCLGFVNTRYWRGSEVSTEELNSLDDLLAWCGAKAGAGPELLRQAREELPAGSPEAESDFRQAIALREALAAIFRATAEERSPAKGDLAALDEALAAAPARSRILRSGGDYFWQVAQPEPALRLLLAPVLWSAADLLTGKRLGRVRRCGNDRCLWLFLDDSKSGNRRWCFMSSCGNRAKAHRHRAKKKQEGAT
jgi:predicted RNA-binding Zn ribbon-like protein